MERHFALPITFAAAAHAALLFGFSKTPHIPAPPEPPVRRDEFILVKPADPEPVATTNTGERQSAPADIAKPALPETTAVLKVDDFRVDPSPPPPINVDNLKSIPVGPPGRGTGIIGVDTDIVGAVNLDNPPRTRFQASPLYPFDARRDGLRGEVMVEFVVDESGHVTDPRVVSSSHRVFEEPSLRAVAKWQFEPGRRHGRIVRFRMAVPVVFSLND
jgi:protein TonB